MAPPFTLQINLVPGDVPVAEHTVPHQLRQLGRLAQEILLVVDVPPADPVRRASWDALWPRLEALIASARAQHPNVRFHPLSEHPSARERLSQAFFGGRAFPPRDFRGRPFDAYLTGISEAANDRVFHLDSDLLLGGAAEGWLEDAEVMLERVDVLCCGPLPGPPTADGSIRRAMGAFVDPAGAKWTLHFRRFTTRAFYLRRSRFLSAACPLKTRRPAPIHAFRAWRGGFPIHRELEHLIARSMRRRGLLRVDFLGRAPGFWSVHPIYRSPELLEALPELVRRVETGEVPDGQRGDEELNDSMVDWTSARLARKRRRS